MDKIEIAYSKSSIISNILLLLLFMLAGADVFLNGHRYETYIFYNKFIISYILPLPYFFLISMGVFTLFPKLFSSKKGLIISGQGIVINTSNANFGLVRWEDIANIEVKEIVSKKVITIQVTDPQIYLKRIKNPLFLYFLRRRVYKHQYLITISSDLLAINTDNLLKLIGDFNKIYEDSKETS